MWFWWRGDVQQTHILAEGGFSSRGADVSMKDFSAFLDTGRCRNCAHKILSWKYPTIWRPVLPVFPRAQRASFLLSTLTSFQGVLTVSGCSGSWFIPCRGRWQVPICGWQKFKSQVGATAHTYWVKKNVAGMKVPMVSARKGLSLTGIQFSWVSLCSQF